MQNNTKSSVIAGVLGVFLGAFGGHDWYLGNTKKAITHVSLCVGGLILLMVGLILTNLFKNIPALNALSICVIIASYVIIVGNGIWGFIEGVSIIAGGDAGLAAKGYQVAAEANTTMAPTDPNASSDDKTNAAKADSPDKTPITPAAPNPDVLTAAPASSSIAAPATEPVAQTTSTSELDIKTNPATEPTVSSSIPEPADSETRSESSPESKPISAPFAPVNTSSTPAAAPATDLAPESTPTVAPSSTKPVVSTPVTPTAAETPKTPEPTPEAPKPQESPSAPTVA